MSTPPTPSLVRRFPLLAYVALAFALTWWVYPLLPLNPLFGLLGLFGPALAAVVVTALTEGRPGVRALLRRAVLWRVPLPWYAVALGLPAAVALLAATCSVLFGPAVLQVGTLSALDLVLGVLVVGEELGWRGYALPKLLERSSALVASVLLGLVWGLWHLPTFLIPGTPQHGQPFVAFLVLTVSYSVLLTCVWLRTSGSVLIATLFHASINISQGVLLAGTDPGSRYWWLALAYGSVALLAVAVLGPRLTRRTTTTDRPIAAV